MLTICTGDSAGIYDLQKQKRTSAGSLVNYCFICSLRSPFDRSGCSYFNLV